MDTLNDFKSNTLVSDCCSAGYASELGICLECMEHCNGVDEDDEAKDMRLAIMDR